MCRRYVLLFWCVQIDDDLHECFSVIKTADYCLIDMLTY